MPSQPLTTMSGNTSAKRVRLSRLIIIVVGFVVLVAGFFAFRWVQTLRGRQKLLIEARTLSETKGKEGQAITFLREYLSRNPNDLEAMELWSDILFRTSQGSPEQLGSVVKADEAILRLDPNPDGDRAQSTRKRLVEAHLLRGPYLPVQEQQYETARILVEAIEKRLKKPDAEVLRLHAQVVERLAARTDEAKFRAAADLYQQAQALDPKSVIGASRIAFLNYFILHDKPKAVAALNALLQVEPTVPAYLAVTEFHRSVAQEDLAKGRQADAAAEIVEADRTLATAVKTAPKNVLVRVTAATVAITKKQPAEARMHLDAVAEADRSDYRYRLIEGYLELLEKRTDDAVESWSRGLVITGGNDRELSFRLAYVLLSLGRIDEAEPLIDQYRRLIGGRDPTPECRYLQAMRLLKLNHPVDAIAELEKAKLVVAGTLKPQYFLLLGQCRQATRDTTGAMLDYKVAIEADPRSSLARLARVRLLELQNPEEAISELRRGLADVGDDPAMWSELARMEFRIQARLPVKQRSFDNLNAIVAKATEVAPQSAGAIIARAQQLTTQGKPDEASLMLEKATKTDKLDVSLWLARAEQLAIQNKFDESLMVLDQASDPKAAGDQALLRIYRAKLLTSLARGTEAREGLVRDQERVPPDQRPMLWEDLGRLYDSQKDPQNARRAYAKCASLLPDDPMPWLLLLELSLNDSATADAQAMVEESMSALKRIGGFYSLVGETIVALRDPTTKETPEARQARLDKAQKLVEQVEAANSPTRFPPLLRASLMEKKGDLNATAEALEKAMLTENGQNFALVRLNRIYTDLKRDKDLKRLRDANPAVGRFQAELFLIQGEKTRAEALARQLAAADSDNMEVRAWEVMMLNTLGKPAEAEKILNDVIAKMPTKLDPRRALMLFLIRQNRRADAVKVVEQMIANVKDVDFPEYRWAEAWRTVGEQTRAAEAFDKAVQKWPEDVKIIRAATEFFESVGQSEKAEAMLRQIIARLPDNQRRWAERSLALLLAGRNQTFAWREAWNLVAKTSKRDETVEDRLSRAIVLSANPDPTKLRDAVAEFRLLLNDLPADLPFASVARAFLARTLLRTGEAPAAAEIAAIDGRTGNNASAILLFASTSIAAGKIDEATKAVDRLAQISPEDINVVSLRAQILKLKGQSAAASKLLFDVAAAKLEAPNGELIGRYIVRTLLEDIKDLDAADAVATILAKRYPNSIGVRAVVLSRQGKTQQAMELYLDAARQTDVQGILEVVRNAMSVVNSNQDEATIAQVAKVVEAAQQRSPNSADLNYMAGMVRHYQGRYADEIHLYETALENRPGDISVLNNMAWTISVSLNDPNKGLDRITQAFNASPNPPPQFYDTLGVILTKLNRTDDAIRNLELAVKDRPTPLVYAHLARAYYNKKKFDKFRLARDQAKKAGLTLDKIDKDERESLGKIIFGPEP